MGVLRAAWPVVLDSLASGQQPDFCCRHRDCLGGVVAGRCAVCLAQPCGGNGCAFAAVAVADRAARLVRSDSVGPDFSVAGQRDRRAVAGGAGGLGWCRVAPVYARSAADAVFCGAFLCLLVGFRGRPADGAQYPAAGSAGAGDCWQWRVPGDCGGAAVFFRGQVLAVLFRCAA